jgi:hypothetical protein
MQTLPQSVKTEYDVYQFCPHCAQPWHVLYLLCEAPAEWGASGARSYVFAADGHFCGTTDPVREAAEALGWRFESDAILSFERCPCCKSASPLAVSLRPLAPRQGRGKPTPNVYGAPF